MKKLSESVWGSIRKKSLGQEARLEDNVNDLDLKGFTEYLKDKYSETATTQTKSSQIRTDGINSIYMPILSWGYNAAYELIYEFERHRLLIRDRYNSNPKLPSKLKFLIKSYVFTTFDSVGESEFFTKQGKSIETNEQVIEIIEMILDNYKGEDLMISRKVSESVWGSIRKKSLGQEERIENDINNLDGEGLTDYLKKHYKPLNAFAIITIVGNIISVPIIRDHTNSCIMFSHETKSVKMTNDIMDQVQGLLRVMENNFSIETFEGEDGNGEYKVYKILPKDGSEVTNKFFIEVIDFLLYHIPGHLYKKSIMKIDDKS